MTEYINEENKEMKVGDILRNARTTGRRKRELSTIAKQLCIREDFLQALEDGNYSLIPETVYILGFARNYAMELGLDPDEIVLKIKHELGLETGKHECENKQEEAESINCSLPETGKKDKAFNWKKAVKSIQKNWIWLMGAMIAVIIAVILLVFFLPDGSVNTSNVTENSVELSGGVESGSVKYNMQVRESFGTENAENAEVVLQAIQESWVKVEDRRGNTVFSRVLLPGDIYYVPSEDEYKATFGNAGGIDVWVEGKVIPKLGAEHTRVAGISMSASDLKKGSQQ